MKGLKHRNCLGFYELIETKKYIYFILEYVEGGSLYKLLKRFGVFPEPLVAVYIEQALQALAYVHEKGILHRDIKGANLLGKISTHKTLRYNFFFDFLFQ